MRIRGKMKWIIRCELTKTKINLREGRREVAFLLGMEHKGQEGGQRTLPCVLCVRFVFFVLLYFS